MSTIINPDKHIVKEANRILRNKGAGYCPFLLETYGKQYNCKKEPCNELICGMIENCPYNKYINEDKENV